MSSSLNKSSLLCKSSLNGHRKSSPHGSSSSLHKSSPLGCLFALCKSLLNRSSSSLRSSGLCHCFTKLRLKIVAASQIFVQHFVASQILVQVIFAISLQFSLHGYSIIASQIFAQQIFVVSLQIFAQQVFVVTSQIFAQHIVASQIFAPQASSSLQKFLL